LRYRTGNTHAHDLEHIAGYRSLMAHWRSLYGDRILEVRYEDLLVETERETARIFAFCGVPEIPIAGPDLNRDGIGGWKPYADHLGPLLERFRDRGG